VSAIQPQETIQMNIRDAVYADSSDLAHLQVDSYRQAYAGLLPQEYLDHFSYDEQTLDWQELLAGERNFILLVAEYAGGRPAGYALGHAGETDVPGFDGELDALHVGFSSQRQGIGRALLVAMADRLSELGATSLVVWVLTQNPARALYERLGGRIIGKRNITLGEGDVVAEEIAYGWEDILKLRM
jgi:ribosomal protein S18 acetylase RimI-like enzyme